MLSNNNQSCIQKLSYRMFKSNKMRNSFIIIAIIMTTAILTSIFNIAYNLSYQYDQFQIRQLETSARMIIENADTEIINATKQSQEIENYGLYKEVSKIHMYNSEIPMMWYDQNAYEEHIKPVLANIEGKYPTQYNEVMLSKNMLEVLDVVKPKIGMTVTILQHDYILSGWFEKYQTNLIYVSQNYMEQNASNIKSNIFINININNEINFVNSLKNINPHIEDSIKTMATMQNNSLLSSTLTMGILFALLVMMSGYLLIYNVMYISVVKDTKFYGLLSTLGMTEKQIRQVVVRQTLYLSGIGISIGLILGCIASFGVVPIAIDMINQEGLASLSWHDVRIYPIAIIIASLFSLLTVFLGASRPAKNASKLSPVLAMKSMNQSRYSKKLRRSRNNGKLHKLAFHNIFRNKKKAFTVFASLIFGISLYLFAAAFFQSIDNNAYIQYTCPHDYMLISIDGSQFTFDDAFVKKIQDIDKSVDIEKVAAIKCQLPALTNDEFQNTNAAWCMVLNDEQMKRFIPKQQQDEFEAGKIVMASTSEENQQSVDEFINKNIDLMVNENVLNVRVTGVLSESEILRATTYSNYDLNSFGFVVSENFVKKINGQSEILALYIDSPQNISGPLKTICQNNDNYLFMIQTELLSEFQQSMTSMNLLATVISFILFLIGIMNFVNVMITNVYVRKQEIAMMESIGMTQNQVKKLLLYEGLYHFLIVTGLIQIVGNIIFVIIKFNIKNMVYYATFQYPFLSIMLLEGILLLICILVPLMSYHTIDQRSVSERLREIQE